MINKAKARLAGNQTRNHKLMLGDACNLPYKDDAFDLLVNNYMLDLLPNKMQIFALKEFKRVLKHYGEIIVTTMTRGRRWYNRIWDIIAKNAPSLLTGCRPVNMGSALKRAGFRIICQAYISQNTFPSLVISARQQ